MNRSALFEIREKWGVEFKLRASLGKSGAALDERVAYRHLGCWNGEGGRDEFRLPCFAKGLGCLVCTLINNR